MDVEYSINAFNNACSVGHVKILDWFKDHNMEIKCDEYSIGFACLNNCVNILEWFKANNLPIVVYDEVFKILCGKNNIKMHEWLDTNNIINTSQIMEVDLELTIKYHDEECDDISFKSLE